MEALFLKLLNLSMTAGWLILAIVVLRLIFRRAPRWVFCLLWGLAALRLVCPVTIESVVSLIPSAQPLPDNIIYTANPAINSGVPPIDSVVNPILESTLTVTDPALPVSANPTQIWSFLLSCVWVFGIVIMLGYALISYLLLRRRVATATLLRENIKQSERVDSPFVLGLLRPTIYLPYAMDEADMGHVIAHERAHIRRGDHWWKPLGFLILAVYWFNPLVWVAYILFCRDMELACDEKVAANLAHEERQAYSTALLHCGVHRRTVAACPLAFGEVGVKSRVKSVMHYKKPAFWVVLIAIVACIVVAVCFLTVPRDDRPHTLEVTGLPAPESGKDPYERLEPAERAAAFLANADMMSYEFDPLVIYGEYVIPTMPATPVIHEVEGQTITTNNLQPILERLHNFDLTALTPIDVTVFDPQDQISGLIHVGDARCRMAIWYDKANRSEEQEVINSALVFTFADGTMCAFDGGNLNSYITDPWEAIDQAGSARNYAFNANITTESNVTVTELATGERHNMNAAAAAYVECVFENTPRLSDPVKSEAEFPWKIEILDGGTYWYNPEEGLITPDGDYKVYAIGGFEPAFAGDTRSELLELMIPGSILTPFGYQVSGSGENLKIQPPAGSAEDTLRQKFPEYFDLNTAKGLDVYVWKTAENTYRCGLLPGTNRDKTDEEISNLSANGTSIEEMKLILSSYPISADNIILMLYSPSNSSYFQPLYSSDIQKIYTSFGNTVTDPVENASADRELEQTVWQVTVDGGLSPEDAAWEMAQQIAANYLALPDEIRWKPEGVRVTNAEVFDHYWGKTPQFCFRIGLDVKMTQEQRWHTGSWGSWGGDTESNGWWPLSAEVYVRKSETGDWAYRSWGTGGYSVNLSDGEGLAYLLDCFWLTEGWTHDWILPYGILDMTDEQLKELPALLDQRTEAEAKEFCAHLGTMLRENDYWVQSIETLKPILGRYGAYLDA